MQMEIVGPQQHCGPILQRRIAMPPTHKYCLFLTSAAASSFFFPSSLCPYSFTKSLCQKPGIYTVQFAIVAAAVDLLIITVAILCCNPQMQTKRRKKYACLHLRQWRIFYFSSSCRRIESPGALRWTERTFLAICCRTCYSMPTADALKKNCEEKTSNPDGLEILMTYGA